MPACSVHSVNDSWLHQSWKTCRPTPGLLVTDWVPTGWEARWQNVRIQGVTSWWSAFPGHMTGETGTGREPRPWGLDFPSELLGHEGKHKVRIWTSDKTGNVSKSQANRRTWKLFSKENQSFSKAYIVVKLKKCWIKLGAVVHTCNPSILGSWGRRIPSSKPASATYWDPTQFNETLSQYKKIK